MKTRKLPLTNAENAMAVFVQATATTIAKFFAEEVHPNQRTRENFLLCLNGYLDATIAHEDTPPGCVPDVQALRAGLDHALLQLDALDPPGRLQ